MGKKRVPPAVEAAPEPRMMPEAPGLWWGSWVGGPPEPFCVREPAEAGGTADAVGLLGPPVEAVPAADPRFIWFAAIPGPAVAASLARLEAAVAAEMRLAQGSDRASREWAPDPAETVDAGLDAGPEALARAAYHAACEEVDVATDKLRDAICAQLFKDGKG